jgi:hypothetical protein
MYDNIEKLFLYVNGKNYQRAAEIIVGMAMIPETAGEVVPNLTAFTRLLGCKLKIHLVPSKAV